MSMYTQLADYVLALRTYIHTATDLPLDRIIFAKPEIARRKLIEKLYRTETPPADKTVEVDNFISFWFSPSIKPYAEARSSVMQDMWGAVGGKTNKFGYVINQDMEVMIDVWGGPAQTGHEFVFNNQMLLKNKMRRQCRVVVQFRDIATKNPADPRSTFDVNCNYEFVVNDMIDNSNLENQFTEGERYRATFDIMWMVSFYNMPSNINPIAKIKEIIVELEEQGQDDKIEVDVTSTGTVVPEIPPPSGTSTTTTFSTTSSSTTTM